MSSVSIARGCALESSSGGRPFKAADFEQWIWSDEMSETQELQEYRDTVRQFVDDVMTVANSCAFVVDSLPAKQKPAINAIADELYSAVARYNQALTHWNGTPARRVRT